MGSAERSPRSLSFVHGTFSGEEEPMARKKKKGKGC
jgi:hypothetical protein